METRVSFYSDRYKIAATLFVPDNLPKGQKRSGVVFCEGFTGIMNSNLGPAARYFSENGYVCLTFDYRCFGQSEGPKWRLLPMNDVEDARSAITFLQQQPQVDKDNIGIIGTSFGSSVAIYVAAVDERVKCVALNVPGGGRKGMRSRRNDQEWQALQKELEEDRVRRVLTGTSKMIAWEDIIRDAESEKYHAEKVKRNPDACTHLPLETLDAMMDFKPYEVIDKIAPRPVLFTVAEKDIVAPIEGTKELYDKAGEPKKFVIIAGCTHYGAYGPPFQQQIIKEELSWFQRYMPAIKGKLAS